MLMKTILVPTDFSDDADNAMSYAVEIAKITSSKIILFHAFHIPAVPMDTPVFITSFDEIEKICMAQLKTIERNIHQKHGSQIDIECACKCGFAVDGINEIALEKNIDLVVMGMHGSSYWEEKLIGSNTTTLIRNTKWPVLAINKNVKFKSIKKIVLACDYHKIKDKSILNILKEFVKLFQAHVYVLNVVHELEMIPSMSEAVEAIELNHSLEDISNSFHNIENENIMDGINEFVEQNKSDMIVMIPHEHTFLENMFSESNTKQMTFHANIPLLALSEKKHNT